MFSPQIGVISSLLNASSEEAQITGDMMEMEGTQGKKWKKCRNGARNQNSFRSDKTE